WPAPGSPSPASMRATWAPNWNAAHPASNHAASDASTPIRPRIKPNSAETPTIPSNTQSIAIIAVSGYASRMRAHKAVRAQLAGDLGLELVRRGAIGDRPDLDPIEHGTIGVAHLLDKGAQALAAGAIAQGE